VSHQVSTQRGFSTLANAVNPLYQVLISGTVTDELTGLPPIGELTVSVVSVGTAGAADDVIKTRLVPKMVGSGLFCFAGEAKRLFPQLAAQGVSVVFSVGVAGYKPYVYTLAIAPGSSFPLPPLDIRLERVPVRIQGYVVEAMPTVNKPIAQARVRCTLTSSSGTISTLDTLSDDSGYYRLDGVGGAMSVLIEVQAPKGTGLRGEPVKWSIEYGQPINNVDFRLLPS
jgi:hypothetical protein